MEGDDFSELNVSEKGIHPPPFAQRDHDLPHLRGICFIDDHEILVQGLPLQFSAKQLVPQKSRAL